MVLTFSGSVICMFVKHMFVCFLYNCLELQIDVKIFDVDESFSNFYL